MSFDGSWNEILKIALKGGASDIHLKSGLPPKFRVDGALVPLKNGRAPDGLSAVVTNWPSSPYHDGHA